MTAAGEKNWLAQNWVWVVPLGVVILAIIAAVVIGPLYIGNAASIRRTSAYKEAIRRVAAHPRVRQQLGNPIEAGSDVEGDLQITGLHGFADFTIPVTGPKGKGTIGVEATLIRGTWNYQFLALQVEGSSESIVVEGKQPRLDMQAVRDSATPEVSQQGQLPRIPVEEQRPPKSGPPQESPTPEESPPETPVPETPKSETPQTQVPAKEESSVKEPSKDSN